MYNKNYRVKEVRKNGKNYFVPQKKFLWWWNDITEIVDADITGYVDEKTLKFSNYDDCVDFLHSNRKNKKIIYHYIT